MKLISWWDDKIKIFHIKSLNYYSILEFIQWNNKMSTYPELLFRNPLGKGRMYLWDLVGVLWVLAKKESQSPIDFLK